MQCTCYEDEFNGNEDFPCPIHGANKRTFPEKQTVMKENKIPTAEEMEQSGKYESYQSMMLAFAKMHVKAALEEASNIHNKIREFPGQFKELQGYHSLKDNLIQENNLILSSYPLENIK